MYSNYGQNVSSNREGQAAKGMFKEQSEFGSPNPSKLMYVIGTLN